MKSQYRRLNKIENSKWTHLISRPLEACFLLGFLLHHNFILRRKTYHNPKTEIGKNEKEKVDGMIHNIYFLKSYTKYTYIDICWFWSNKSTNFPISNFFPTLRNAKNWRIVDFQFEIDANLSGMAIWILNSNFNYIYTIETIFKAFWWTLKKISYY